MIEIHAWMIQDKNIDLSEKLKFYIFPGLMLTKIGRVLRAYKRSRAETKWKINEKGSFQWSKLMPA